MKLKWLKLQHFRNYENLELTLNEGVTALVGLNAQGKTNLLESIAFLALGKSFRAPRSLDALKWDRPHGRIKAGIERKGKLTELEVFMQRDPELKKIKKQSRLTKPKNFLGSFRVVLFTPDQLELISGSPQARRQFLDRLLIQVDYEYTEALGNYHKILNHRNALLKSIWARKSEEWELDIWDARLATEARKIWEKRSDFFNFLNGSLAEQYQKLAGAEEVLSLESLTHQDRYEERLLAHRGSDIQSGSTSVGPHRDDFTLSLHSPKVRIKRELAESGSRGEQRSAVLVLKMAELLFIENKTGEKPILLLDDVFSELDLNRQKKLIDLIRPYQSILTTTSLEHLESLKNLTVYNISQGEIQHCT